MNCIIQIPCVTNGSQYQAKMGRDQNGEVLSLIMHMATVINTLASRFLTKNLKIKKIYIKQ